MKYLLLRAGFLLFLGIALVRAEPTPLDSQLAGKSDMAFFFDSISYADGKWRFELSRNAMGMLWRTVKGKDDVTGVCNYKQTLVVWKSSTLEIKAKGISILFRPAELPDSKGQPAFKVWKRTGTDDPNVEGVWAPSAVLVIGDDGSWHIYPPPTL
jgi:hypothetical protein